MIRRPGHLADTEPPTGVPTDVPGLDFERAGINVEAAGGSAERFRHALAAGQRALPVDASSDLVVALAGISGWRAGVPGLRDDALAHLADVPPVAAAAALGLAEGDLDAFAEHQRTDRFWWPGRPGQRGYVCAVGGFAGLGGAWTAPPTDPRPLDADGAFAVRTGERWWRVDADVWGSRLVALEGEPLSGTSRGSGPAASLLTFAESYLAWIYVAEPA
ncbi:potassium transporter Kef [uncultured Microbacterium sp.]|uniref:potassium transporter Kef n=1 Tax=uncultured Microbacterium sp. TaxID=191216 RepID=UPI0025EBDCDF|nr:potassium transporter Kef [uncultured Microbacterium sp.]